MEYGLDPSLSAAYSAATYPHAFPYLPPGHSPAPNGPHTAGSAPRPHPNHLYQLFAAASYNSSSFNPGPASLMGHPNFATSLHSRPGRLPSSHYPPQTMPPGLTRPMALQAAAAAAAGFGASSPVQPRPGFAPELMFHSQLSATAQPAQFSQQYCSLQSNNKDTLKTGLSQRNDVSLETPSTSSNKLGISTDCNTVSHLSGKSGANLTGRPKKKSAVNDNTKKRRDFVELAKARTEKLINDGLNYKQLDGVPSADSAPSSLSGAVGTNDNASNNPTSQHNSVRSISTSVTSQETMRRKVIEDALVDKRLQLFCNGSVVALLRAKQKAVEEHKRATELFTVSVGNTSVPINQNNSYCR